MKRRHQALGVGALLVLLCAIGPRQGAGPSDAEGARAAVPADVSALPAWVARDAQIEGVRPGNGSRIHWVEEGVRSALGIVYMHGYSASPAEIEPVLERLSVELGANVYSPRFAGHGCGAECMGPVKAGAWFDDAEQALAVGEVMAERTVVIGTSTGGSIAALAALEHPELAGLVLISPNFGPQDRTADALLMPWLGHLLPRVMPDHCWDARNAEQEALWTTCYPVESVASMMVAVDHTRDADWSALKVPVLVMRSDQDGVVQQPAIDEWLASLPVPTERVVVQARDDESGHVLAGAVTAPSQVDGAVTTIAAWVGALDSAGASPK